MPDFGVLISVPTESVAIRATVGSLVATVVVALLLRAVLRTPRVRSAAVLLPVATLLVAVGLSWGELLLPTLMTAASEGAVEIRVGDSYLPMAPVGWPLITALWAAVAGLRVTRRVRYVRQMRRIASAGAPPRDVRIHRIARRVAGALRVAPPRVVVVDGCPGGAVVVGFRHPTVVVDADLLADLDDEELEGLLAHELAHVRRRDNLLGLCVGLVRDACFFVPGGRWVANRLCEEREVAADHIAVRATRRPGALASGLLKVIDHRRADVACATFAAASAVVARVERLLADGAGATPKRVTAESAMVAAVLTGAVAVAVQLPATISAQSSAGDALAFVWAWQNADEAVVAAEAPAFRAFRHEPPSAPAAPRPSLGTAEPGQEFRQSRLRAGPPPAGAAATEPRIDMPDSRSVTPSMLERWRARPLVDADAGVGLYWLRRLDGAR